MLAKDTFNKKFTELRSDLEKKIVDKVNAAYLKKVEVKYE